MKKELAKGLRITNNSLSQEEIEEKIDRWGAARIYRTQDTHTKHRTGQDRTGQDTLDTQDRTHWTVTQTQDTC